MSFIEEDVCNFCRKLREQSTVTTKNSGRAHDYITLQERLKIFRLGKPSTECCDLRQESVFVENADLLEDSELLKFSVLRGF